MNDFGYIINDYINSSQQIFMSAVSRTWPDAAGRRSIVLEIYYKRTNELVAFIDVNSDNIKIGSKQTVILNYPDYSDIKLMSLLRHVVNTRND